MRKKFKKIRRKLLLIVCSVVLVLFSVQIWNYFAPQEAEAAILHWGFDDSYGTTANDTSGNSKSGTITSATWTTSDLCRTNKCLYFDGSGDYVSRADDSDLDFSASDDFTITGWFRRPAISTSPDYLVAKHEAGTAGGYKIYMDSDGDIVFGIDDDGTWGPEDAVGSGLSRNLDDNRWHHFAAAKDGTTGIYLYIDGVLVDSNESLTATGTLANANAFYVGIDSDGSSNGWEGFIDEVKVHRELRTESQIKADFVQGAPEEGSAASFGGSDQSWLSDGLAAYWRMDETTADSCGSTNDNCDSSGNGHHGDWVADATSAAGKFGNAISLDGTGDELDMNTPDNNVTEFENGTTGFTVSAWIYPAFINTDASFHNVISIGDTLSLRFNPNQDDFSLNANLQGTDSIDIVLHTQGLSWDANTWHHITATYDGKNTAIIYWEGEEVVRTESVSGILNQTNSTLIGEDWSGRIDEVRLYTQSLSAKEIEKLYNWAPEPVGHWSLDENTGTSTVNDISTNGNSGTMVNIEEQDWVPGKYGSALTLDGNDQYITRSDDADFDFAANNSFSVMAWVKHDTQTSGQDVIISKFASAGYKLYMESDGDFTFGIDDDGTSFPEDSVSTTAASYDDGQWHHVAGVKEGTSNIKIYVDGVLRATNSSLSATGSLENTGPIYLGIDADGTSNAWLGEIDDIRIYNYARNQSQIIEDLNGGHPAPGSPVGSPISRWKFDENYGTTAHDQISGNDLTLSTASWTASGKFGSAFDGTGANRLSIADNPDFDFAASEDFTLSVWFRSDSATNPGANEFIIAKGTGTGYGLFANTSGFISFGIDSDGTWTPADTATSTTDFYDGTWHHAVAVKTGTSRIDLYIDGNLVGSDTSIAATGSLENSDPLIFADQDTSDNGNEFFGDIDEASIYRLALTSDQIKILFNQGATRIGALSTDSTGITPSDSKARSYCVPGDTSTCNPPVAEWLMDENTGTGTDVVYDTSNNGFDGDTEGTMTEDDWVPGKYGSALNFDGTDDRVSIGVFNEFSGDTAFTLSAWIKPNFLTTYASSAGIFYAGAFNLRFNPGQDDFTFALITSTGATNLHTTGLTWNQNSWHHILIKYDGATMDIYWDGFPEGSVAKTGTINNSLAESYIGLDAAGGGYWLGALDQIRIYDYAMTNAQIQWEYNRGAPLVHFKLDECTGSTANNSAPDPSGGDLDMDGTITIGPGGTNTSTGTCSSGTGTQAWNNGTTGKRNSSLDFDGADDVITIGTDQRIDFDTGLAYGVSFSAWIYANSDGETDVGRIFSKGSTNTFCRTASQSGDTMDLECSMDLTITDATLNIAGALTTNTWHHIVMTYVNDADNEITVYVDGINRGSSTNGDGTTATDTANLQLGGDGGGNASFDGQIDEFMLFNYELTGAQVKSIVNQGAVNFGPSTGAN